MLSGKPPRRRPLRRGSTRCPASTLPRIAQRSRRRSPTHASAAALSAAATPPQGDAAERAAQAERLRKMLLAMVDDIRVVLIKLAERTAALRHLMAGGSERKEARQQAA